jgi:preprotein translocase subunit YajC
MGKGDTVVTAGGIYGKIREVRDDSFMIEIDQNVKIRVDKNSVYPSASEAAADAQQK